MRFTVPGLPNPIPTVCAPAVFVPVGQRTELFGDLYGDFEIAFARGDGGRTTGGDATATIVYRDDGGRFDSLVVSGPVAPGTFPSTYTGGNGHHYYTPGDGCFQ
jgi:hypothetical protein